MLRFLLLPFLAFAAFKRLLSLLLNVESSIPWDSTGVSVDAPITGYTETTTKKFFRDVFTGDDYATAAISPNVGGELAVTSAANQVTVASGGAWVFGTWYPNTSSVNVAVTSPSVGTTGLRVTARADWVAKTVRATVTKNTDGTSAVPAATQIEPVDKAITGATNATPIVITVVGHGYATGNSVRITGVLGNTAANGTWTITSTGTDTFSLNTSVGNGAYTSGGTSTLLTGVVYDVTLATGTIQTNGTISLTDARTFVKMPTALVFRRQGGTSTTDWTVAGTTNHSPSETNHQLGVASVSYSSGTGTAAITFPVAYAGPPLVFLSVDNEASSTKRKLTASIEGSPTTTGFVARVYLTDEGTGSGTAKVNWEAYGR